MCCCELFWAWSGAWLDDKRPSAPHPPSAGSEVRWSAICTPSGRHPLPRPDIALTLSTAAPIALRRRAEEPPTRPRRHPPSVVLAANAHRKPASMKQPS
jgi:hypothetical protein